MNASTRLAAIRNSHFMLAAVPDVLRIPALDPGRDAIEKPIEDATLDDVAFAMRGLEAEFSAVGDRLHALRKLYALAREAGALGAAGILDAVPVAAGGRR